MNISKFILLVFVSCGNLIVQAQAKDSLEVMKATQTFLNAFTNFDWETFRNCFSKDATIFYPVWEQGNNRRGGQKEIETAWLEIFPEFTDSTKKFDLQINPKNILVQLYDKTAIVTFHLGEENHYLARRTLVFIKEKQDWKIVHLHASNLSRDNYN